VSEPTPIGPHQLRIVAFLQNTWVRDPENLKRIYAEVAARGNVDVAKHRNCMITYMLFAGCLSGRRLKAAFGEELCYEIYWEEASTEITGTPSAKVTADPEHIRRVLESQQPDVVLCFGRIACNAVEPLWNGVLLRAPHPAARGDHIVPALLQMRKQLERELIWWVKP